MRAVVYHGPGDVRLEDVPSPKARTGELLLRVATVGICGTDVGEYVHEPLFFPIHGQHPQSGHEGPTIPGHELSGWVTDIGPAVSGFDVGDLVAVGSGVSCGACPPCLRGNTNMCQRYWTVGLHANGGLAEEVAVPASCTLNLSARLLTPDLAALTQPMSIAVHATRRGRVGEGDSAVVIGAGGIGSFITFAAARSGATVTAIDIDPARLVVASRLGATRTIDASTVDIDDTLAELEPPTVVFECTARPESLVRALVLTAESGRLVVLGHQPQPVTVDFKLVSMGEREIIGTMAHAFAADFALAADRIGSDPEAWTAVAPTVYPLVQVVEQGFEPMSRGTPSQTKLLFDPSLETPRPLGTGKLSPR